ncbi:MAG: ATP-binding protein [Thermodesulfobacteriota bacterium]
MNILALPAALAFTMNFTLCLIVLSSKPKELTHQLFAGFVLSFATWNMGEIIMINSTQPHYAIFGVKIIFVGLTLAPFFFLQFSFVFPFPQETLWRSGWRRGVLYLIPVALLITFFMTFRIDIEKFKELSNVYYYGLRFEEPSIFLIFLGLITLFSTICIYWGIRNLIHSFRTTRIPRYRLQIKYLIFGILSMALAGTVINLTNYFLKLGWPIFFLASLYSILVSLFFAIALIKYRLLDIHLLIRGGLLYSAVSGFVLSIYILIIKNIGETISHRAYGKSLLVESALILILVFMFRPMQRRIGDWIDRFFYMERMIFRTKLAEFGRTLTELLELQEVVQLTCKSIKETLHVKEILFYLLDEKGEFLPMNKSSFEMEKKFLPTSPLVMQLSFHKRAVDLRHLQEKEGRIEEVEELLERGWVVGIPIFLKERMQGFLLLGEKQSQKDYTTEELELLEAFSNQMTLGISRALIYREMSLKDRQIMQAEKMVAIGELASGIAHEIRNPLGIITASAETLRKHKDEKIRKEMTDYILEESQRINQLINSFLDLARPKETKRERTDLREVLEKTLLLLSPQAHRLGVEIKREIPEWPFLLEIDPEQMEQAFMNIGVNALEAMPNGGIFKVRVRENGKGRVLVEFSDTGKGIPKEMREKIFEPFFTTKERGTGLGLPIAQRIITQHGGRIDVEDGDNGGTIFTITLPIGEIERDEKNNSNRRR